MTEKTFRKFYPPEVIELMLVRQQEQGNPKTIKPFLKDIRNGLSNGAFDWSDTIEEHDFWDKVLIDKDFDLFYSEYPKKNNQILILI